MRCISLWYQWTPARLCRVISANVRGESSSGSRSWPLIAFSNVAGHLSVRRAAAASPAKLRWPELAQHRCLDLSCLD